MAQARMSRRGTQRTGTPPSADTQPSPAPRVGPGPAGPASPEEFLVPGGHGRAFTASAGARITIIDVHGRQAGSFVAVAQSDAAETLSGSETRRRQLSLFLRTGDTIYTSRGRPMFRVLADTLGRHDFTGPACNAAHYEHAYGIAGHRNCHDNLAAALAPHGVPPDSLPEPLALFQDPGLEADARIGERLAVGRPGERFVITPLIDVICALSPSPDDISPLNDLQPSDLLVRMEAARCSC